MNYQKVYNSICKRGKVRSIEGYTEKHHIVMKSLGGDDSPENITILTAREHFLVHWLLARIHPNNYKVQAAFKMMCDVKYGKRYTPSSRVVAEARENASRLDSIRKTGKKLPQEHVENIRASKIGLKQPKSYYSSMESYWSKIRGGSNEIAKGTTWINNGIESKMSKGEDLQNYINLGWKVGRLPVSKKTKNKKSKLSSGRVWINDSSVEKFIKKNELDYFLNNGFYKGRLLKQT